MIANKTHLKKEFVAHVLPLLERPVDQFGVSQAWRTFVTELVAMGDITQKPVVISRWLKNPPMVETLPL